MTYVGQEEVARDIANLKAAAAGQRVTELCLTALAPATAEFFMLNQFYPSDEAYVYAITEADILLQLDEPALATNWHVLPDMDLPQFRKWVELRVEALNHALRGIPPERVRMHVCWGSIHHPHRSDIPLESIVDLLLKVNAQGRSLEAANPRHGRERVIGGTDCGLGTRVGHPKIGWAKFEALSQGARTATERLWGGDHTHAH